MLTVVEVRNPDNPKDVVWQVWGEQGEDLLTTNDILEISGYLMNSGEDFTLTKKSFRQPDDVEGYDCECNDGGFMNCYWHSDLLDKEDEEN